MVWYGVFSYLTALNILFFGNPTQYQNLVNLNILYLMPSNSHRSARVRSSCTAASYNNTPFTRWPVDDNDDDDDDEDEEQEEEEQEEEEEEEEEEIIIQTT